ncbi:hypothetical protein OC844_000316, partial [Tilletia horrida]
MAEPPDDASTRSQGTGTGVPQASAPPKVSYPENNKFVGCDSTVRSALASKLNGAGSPSADTLGTFEADAALVHREPPPPPAPQGAHRQDAAQGTDEAMDLDPTTGPETGNPSWFDPEDEEAAAAAAAAAIGRPAPDAPMRPETPSGGGKRREPDGTPRKDRDEEERRMLLQERRAKADMPPPPLPAQALRRRSSRIEVNNIAPASGRQQIVSGVSRAQTGSGNPDWAAAPPTVPAVAPARPTPGERTPAAAAPTAKNAAAAERTGAGAKTGRPFQALDQMINRSLDARQRREDSVQDFLKNMSQGLQAMDGYNALNKDRISAIRTLTTTVARLVLASPDSTTLPTAVLDFLDSWDPARPCPPLPTQPVPSPPPTTNATPSPYLAAAKKNGAAKPAQRPLRPQEGYRTQGGAKGDAEKLAADGGVKDTRTFIRLSTDSQFYDEDAMEIRLQLQVLATKYTAKKLTFDRIKKVKSGFSFTPGPDCTAEDFQPLHAQIQAHFDATSVDGPCPHARFCLRGIPAHVVSGGKAKPVTPELIDQYLHQRFPHAHFPVPPRAISRPDDALPLWLVTVAGDALTEADGRPLPSRIAFMDRDCTIRPYRANNASKHCARCLSWHHVENRCRAPAPVCGHCGLTGHTTSEHSCNLCPSGTTP